MLIVLIGHRGVGKSHLLNRFERLTKSSAQPIQCFDLDREIEKHMDQSVTKIFETLGEKKFREIEEQVFFQITKQYENEKNLLVVALGAGFEFQIPEQAYVLWVQRPSDVEGRIFLDRPRLLEGLSPLVEYKEKFRVRQQRFLELSHSSYEMPEGLWFEDAVEHWSLGIGLEAESALNFGGGFTLQSSHLIFSQSLSRLKRAGFDFIELRTDILSEEQLRWACQFFSEQQVLISLRACTYLDQISDLLEGREWDWANELGVGRLGPPTVLSFHSRPDDKSLEVFLESIEACVDENYGHDVHVKVSVEIQNFKELKTLYRWWQEAPKRRSIFPCGESRWTWFRQWMKGRSKLSFVREGYPGQVDQPTLTQWLRTSSESCSFAAVLGHPVKHSWSPSFHSSFFQNKEMPFFSIEVQEEEWAEAMEFLTELGLKAAAVTSPLKRKALSWVLNTKISKEAQEWKAVNTLTCVGEEWWADNTDGVSFAKMIEELIGDSYKGLPKGAVAVWGGGGMLELMNSALPEAVFYSARTGLPRTEFTQNQRDDTDSLTSVTGSVKVLVWAVGASRQKACVWPEESWRPEVILDINYAENSPGREYALKCGARYISGESLFVQQAKMQQELWANV